jgi:hypothetical protein
VQLQVACSHTQNQWRISICIFVLVKQVNWVVPPARRHQFSHAATDADDFTTHFAWFLLIQKHKFWPAGCHPLSHAAANADLNRLPRSSSGVSICTFVLGKQVNWVVKPATNGHLSRLPRIWLDSGRGRQAQIRLDLLPQKNKKISHTKTGNIAKPGKTRPKKKKISYRKAGNTAKPEGSLPIGLFLLFLLATQVSVSVLLY